MFERKTVPIKLMRLAIKRVREKGNYDTFLLNFIAPKLRQRFVNAVEGLIFVYHTFETE